MRNTVITISRQYGSGGGEIGEQLSGNLGIPLYDKQLFMEAACQSGIHRDFFENAEKRGQDRFSYMYGSVTAGHTTLSDRIFLEQSKTIRRSRRVLSWGGEAIRPSGIFQGRFTYSSTQKKRTENAVLLNYTACRNRTQTG